MIDEQRADAEELFGFDIELSRTRGVFRLRGELDLYPLPRLEEACDDAIAKGVRELVFDCGGLTFLGSTGMNFFVKVDRLIRDRGGRMAVVEVAPHIYRLLEITGLHQVLDVERGGTPDEPQAV
ncbi:MAG TPA: STAS domain-containing protein [Acidimicrobiia bacterium]|nr:STAS domain-containing protein [Acidimicrobiia bacterium]